MKRLVIALVIVAGLLGLLRPWKSDSQERSNEISGNLARAGDSANLENEFTKRIRTKSHNRPLLEKPSIEETTELFKTTMIPVVDLPADQSVPERISNINHLIRQAGVDPARLRFILRAGDPAHQWRFEDELHFRNVTTNVVLNYVCGRTKLRCHVRENGVVELTTTFDPEPIPDSQQREIETSETDPFAEP